MPEIIVNINDQDYAIVCDPGEENHLKPVSYTHLTLPTTPRV